jgi:hypothetical protein
MKLESYVGAGTVFGTIFLAIVWPPLAFGYLAVVSFVYAAFIHSQAIVCSECRRSLSPLEYADHVCPPIPRRRKRVT